MEVNEPEVRGPEVQEPEVIGEETETTGDRNCWTVS